MSEREPQIGDRVRCIEGIVEDVFANEEGEVIDIDDDGFFVIQLDDFSRPVSFDDDEIELVEEAKHDEQA